MSIGAKSRLSKWLFFCLGGLITSIVLPVLTNQLSVVVPNVFQAASSAWDNFHLSRKVAPRDNAVDSAPPPAAPSLVVTVPLPEPPVTPTPTIAMEPAASAMPSTELAQAVAPVVLPKETKKVALPARVALSVLPSATSRQSQPVEDKRVVTKLPDNQLMSVTRKKALLPPNFDKPFHTYQDVITRNYIHYPYREWAFRTVHGEEWIIVYNVIRDGVEVVDMNDSGPAREVKRRTDIKPAMMIGDTYAAAAKEYAKVDGYAAASAVTAWYAYTAAGGQ